MSYDYNDILNKIIASREHHPITLHETLDLYAELSDHCSMTPMLWLQYAQDARSVQDSLAKEIVQLALEEFPGCVVLWLYYLDLQRDWEVWIRAKSNLAGSQDAAMLDLYRLAVGCFKNYSPSQVMELYVHRANHIVAGNEAMMEEIRKHTTSLSSSSKGHWNQSLLNELHQEVDLGRRFVSQNLALLQTLEEDIRIALNSEGLLPTVSIMDYFHSPMDDGTMTPSSNMTTFISWDTYLSDLGGIQGKFLMGCGMEHLSSVFINAVHSILQHIRHLKKNMTTTGADSSDAKDHQEHDRHLIQIFSEYITPLYERAISECPTVELLWEKYIKHLLYVLHDAESNTQDRLSAIISLKHASSRAIKNCPYSVKLFTMKMQVVMEEVDHDGGRVFEPDDLMNIVQEAIDAKFLPTNKAHLEVYLAACTIVKRRILELISQSTSSKAFDTSERMDDLNGTNSNRKNKSNDIYLLQYSEDLSDDVQEEVQDLIADLRDMYESTDIFLKKNCQHWTEGREILHTEIAHSEAYVFSSLLPLDSQGKEVVKCFEKLVRVHSPPNPNSWRYYIKYLMGKISMKYHDNDDGESSDIFPLPGMAVAKFRFIRNIYHRAISSIKRLREMQSQADYEYESAARSLYQEYMEFEKMFGSENSYKEASKLLSKKLGSMYTAGQIKHAEELVNDIHQDDSSNGKRKASEDENITNSKRSKVDDSLDEAMVESEEHATLGNQSISESSEQPKKRLWPEKKKIKSEHKIKIGNLEYPAHPYTVHVSNLSLETMDSDLYDLFRPLCGAIVHCRIFRDKFEKYHVLDHGDVLKSKCAGLIQFEEKESVEKALTLSEEIGIHEKLIVVTRSHQSAVSVVPPGMNRIKAKSKGQGDNFKRNQKRKERRQRQEANQLKSDDLEGHGDASLLLKEEEPADADVTNPTSSTTTSTSILSFRPRNLKMTRPKRRI